MKRQMLRADLGAQHPELPLTDTLRQRPALRRPPHPPDLRKLRDKRLSARPEHSHCPDTRFDLTGPALPSQNHTTPGRQDVRHLNTLNLLAPSTTVRREDYALREVRPPP